MVLTPLAGCAFHVKRGDLYLLALRRSLYYGGREIVRTPLLVPSFSSKGFPEVDKILDTATEFIPDYILVSAYDYYYKILENPIEFPELIFLDSGGYECSRDVEYAELGYLPYAPKDWNEEMYYKIVDNWPMNIPTVLISYDHPKHRFKIPKQIELAKSIYRRKAGFIKEILLKPESLTSKFIQADQVVKHVRKLAD